MGRSVYHEHLKRLDISETPRLNVWGSWYDPQPQGPGDSAIIEFATKFKPLIVFDSFIAFHRGSEQDASETRRYMQEYRKLASGGATVLVLHHTGKSEGAKPYRGSSDIKGSVDAAYLLNSKRDLEWLELKPFKIREGKVDPIQITLTDAGFARVGDAEREIVRTIVRDNPNINQGDIHARAGGVSQNKVREILERGIQEGWIEVKQGEKNALLYIL